MSINLLLACRRRALHLSCRCLAHLCRMQADQVYRLEQGSFTPSPSQAWLLAKALILDPEELARWAIWQLLTRPEQLAEHIGAVHFYS